jgi:integrase
LRWRHVDLCTGTLHVREAKTENGVRKVDISPAVRETLTLWRAEAMHTGPSDYLIHSSTGHRSYPSNLRRDIPLPAVEQANVRLEELGIAPIGHLTFHSLRRSYASPRCRCGDDMKYTADQLGQGDPQFALRVYAQAVRRGEKVSDTHLREYDRALQWAEMGRSADLIAPTFDSEATKSPE